MPERIPDTIQDFFQAMKAEFLYVLKEIQKAQEQNHLELLEILGHYQPAEPEIPLPNFGSNEVPPLADDEPHSLSFDTSPVVFEVPPGERMTREQIAHQGHHDGKGYRMSCEYCKEEKYSK